MTTAKKKKPPYNQNSAIRGALRRAFARSPVVTDIMNASRREEPRYKKDGTLAKKPWVKRQCEVCQTWVGSTKVAVDHINPVVSVDDGFQDWNEFIDRLWCDPKNLQRICNTCHDVKTQCERIARLTKQYTKELDKLEYEVNIMDNHRNLFVAVDAFKPMIKSLNKYLAKKKTAGLESIVERAQRLKDKVVFHKKDFNKGMK